MGVIARIQPWKSRPMAPGPLRQNQEAAQQQSTAEREPSHAFPHRHQESIHCGRGLLTAQYGRLRNTQVCPFHTRDQHGLEVAFPSCPACPFICRDSLLLPLVDHYPRATVNKLA